jgi:branched-chain amino acid transport system ATP-binding protein
LASPEASASTAPDAPALASDITDLLSVENLCAGYGRRTVVFDVSFRVGEGEIVTILGHNGAGKTTTLKSVFGLQRPSAGTVRLHGRDITRMPCAQKVQEGICFIPAERFVFPDLSAIDNLRLGWHARSETPIADRLTNVYGTFPFLEERQKQLAGTMSGGQQRILSIGIALMAEPRLILLDEPSLGLAPAMVQNVTNTLRQLVDREAVSIVLLEQNVRHALRIADRAYVMRSGRIILEESAEQMLARGQWWDLF